MTCYALFTNFPMKGCGRQNNFILTKITHFPILRTCDYDRLHGKMELRLHVEARMLISWPRDRKRSPSSQVGPMNQKGTWEWKKEAEEPKEMSLWKRAEWCDMGRIWFTFASFEGGGRGPTNQGMPAASGSWKK